MITNLSSNTPLSVALGCNMYSGPSSTLPYTGYSGPSSTLPYTARAILGTIGTFLTGLWPFFDLKFPQNVLSGECNS